MRVILLSGAKQLVSSLGVKKLRYFTGHKTGIYPQEGQGLNYVGLVVLRSCPL